MRLVSAAVGTFIGVLGTTLHAQDLEPRAYSNSPIGLNFVTAGYGYASGTVLTDPSLPLENVTNQSHVGVLGFATKVTTAHDFATSRNLADISGNPPVAA